MMNDVCVVTSAASHRLGGGVALREFASILLTLLLVTFGSQELSATAVTFDEFPFPSAFPPGTTLNSHEFAIQNLGSVVAEISPCDPPCPSNGTQYLLTQVDGILRITNSESY
jgi:hypothetical protein